VLHHPNLIQTIATTPDEFKNSNAIDVKFETNQDFVACPFHLEVNINHAL